MCNQLLNNVFSSIVYYKLKLNIKKVYLHIILFIFIIMGIIGELKVISAL